MSGGNIKAESAYDPFPRSGLVKQFEPFIRKEVGKFCKRYPKLRRDNWMMGVLSGTDTRSLVQFADDKEFLRLRLEIAGETGRKGQKTPRKIILETRKL